MKPELDVAALTLTPDPFWDESPYGYLLRLTEANGHRGHGLIATLCNGRRRVHGSFSVSSDVAKLATLVGRRLSFHTERMDQLLDQGDKNLGVIAGRVIHAKNAIFPLTKLCPQCLAEHSYWRTWWDLLYVDVCAVHGCKLVRQCGVCGEPIQFRRSCLAACRCGNAFSKLETVPGDVGAIALAEVIETTFGGRCGLSTALGAGLPVEQLCACGPETLISAVGVLINASEEKGKGRYVKAYSRRHKLIPAAASALIHWPMGLHRFLRDRRTKDRAIDQLPTFREEVGRFLITLNLINEKDRLRFLIDEIMRFAYRNCFGQIKAPDGCRGPWPERRFGSTTEGAVLIGIPHHTMLREIYRGRMDDVIAGTIAKPQTRLPQWAINLDAVRRRDWYVRTTEDHRLAGKRFGLGSALVSAIIDSPLVGMYALDVDGCDAVSVLKRLCSLAVGRCPSEGPIGSFNLLELLRSTKQMSRKLALLDALLDGRIDASSDGTTFGSIRLIQSVKNVRL